MSNYARDELNNLVETLSKEEIYSLLAAAIEQGKLPSVDTPTAFVTMIKSIVDGKAYKQAYCTQAQYNELVAEGLVQANTVYYITDDDSYNELVNAINNNANQIQSTMSEINRVEHNTTESINILSAGVETANEGVAEINKSLANITIDPTKTITQTGLYAVVVIIGADGNGYPKYGTAILSIEDLARYSTAYFNFEYSGGTVSSYESVTYSPTDNKLSVAGNVTHTISVVRLIMKY